MEQRSSSGDAANLDRRQSLIERAAARLEDAAHPPPPHGPVNGQAARHAEAGATATVGKPRLEIDLDGLARLGYLTPSKMRSKLAEEMRLIKRAVLHGFREKAAARSNMIMVTSAEPGAGKSFIATNLAMSLASEFDLHVLLIDGDFEQPDILDRLGVSAERGFLDVLAEVDLVLGDVIYRTSVDRLSLIGPGHRRQLVSELLNSQRMRQVTDELAERYPDRLIIFDTSPLLAAAEPAVLSELVGQVMVVVEADKTDRSTLEQALDLLSEDCEPALVLNKGKSRAGASQLYYHDDYRKG